MNLGQLLDRAYQRLGDSKTNPKTFTRTRLVGLINEGCLTFREQVEDAWYRGDQNVVANIPVYTFISDHLRTVRIAFDDETVRPSTVQELQSLDDLWKTRTAATPRAWTSQGQAHNEWRYYPVPDISTSETYNILQNNGVVCLALGPDLALWTFNQATGIVVQMEGYEVAPPTGVVTQFIPSGGGQTTVWGVVKPRTVSGDEEKIPIKIGFHLAPLYYALWQIYEESGVNHNKILAGYYRQQFLALVEDGRVLRDNPLPFEKHVLRGAGAEMYEEATGRPPSPWPSSVDFGSGPISVGWSRKNYW